MLTAFNMTIPGLPVSYYGDEIGLPGGNDPDSRRLMKFDDLNPHEKMTKEIAAKLTHIRKSNMALTYGNFTTLEVSDKTYVYGRQYFANQAIMLFNKGEKPVKMALQLPAWLGNITLEAVFGNDFKIENNILTVELEPWSFEILAN